MKEKLFAFKLWLDSLSGWEFLLLDVTMVLSGWYMIRQINSYLKTRHTMPYISFSWKVDPYMPQMVATVLFMMLIIMMMYIG